MQELLVLMLNLKDLVYERLIGSENQRKKMLAAIKESKVAEGRISAFCFFSKFVFSWVHSFYARDAVEYRVR